MVPGEELKMRKKTFAFMVLGTLLCGACGGNNPVAGADDPAEPAFALALFSGASSQVTNPYFPLRPGATSVFLADTEDGLETIVVDVLDATRVVAGVECVILHDRVYLDGLLIEDTLDWYAQDDDGNVWYLGEEVVNYEYDDDDNLISTDSDGSWEAGVDGAVAGIYMKATLEPGDSYQQEFYEGEAEDMGEVVALDVPVTLADGRLFLCLQTRDWNPLDPASPAEFKYYAAGLGLVAEQVVGGTERAELAGAFDRSPAALPSFAGATFSDPTNVSNGSFPLVPGAVSEFEAETEDGTEETLVEVLAQTRDVDGVTCVVVRDRVYLDGLLIEDTLDWYAQDDDGNVWYMGEEVVNYEYDDDDNLIGTDDGGSWEAGVDGARPGIVMWATPIIGTSYYQEFYEGEAEDMAVVIATGVEVELSDGTRFANCLRILERTALEPEVVETKYYAPGLGVILEEKPGDGESVERLPAP
jgi:hypothetical protein